MAFWHRQLRGKDLKQQRKHFRQIPRVWLEDLQAAGIDLASYGKMQMKEFKKLRRGKIQWSGRAELIRNDKH